MLTSGEAEIHRKHRLVMPRTGLGLSAAGPAHVQRPVRPVHTSSGAVPAPPSASLSSGLHRSHAGVREYLELARS